MPDSDLSRPGDGITPASSNSGDFREELAVLTKLVDEANTHVMGQTLPEIQEFFFQNMPRIDRDNNGLISEYEANVGRRRSDPKLAAMADSLYQLRDVLPTMKIDTSPSTPESERKAGTSWLDVKTVFTDMATHKTWMNGVLHGYNLDNAVKQFDIFNDGILTRGQLNHVALVSDRVTSDIALTLSTEYDEAATASFDGILWDKSQVTVKDGIKYMRGKMDAAYTVYLPFTYSITPQALFMAKSYGKLANEAFSTIDKNRDNRLTGAELQAAADNKDVPAEHRLMACMLRANFNFLADSEHGDVPFLPRYRLKQFFESANPEQFARACKVETNRAHRLSDAEKLGSMIAEQLIIVRAFSEEKKLKGNQQQER